MMTRIVKGFGSVDLGLSTHSSCKDYQLFLYQNYQSLVNKTCDDGLWFVFLFAEHAGATTVRSMERCL